MCTENKKTKKKAIKAKSFSGSEIRQESDWNRLLGTDGATKDENERNEFCGRRVEGEDILHNSSDSPDSVVFLPVTFPALVHLVTLRFMDDGCSEDVSFSKGCGTYKIIPSIPVKLLLYLHRI